MGTSWIVSSTFIGPKLAHPRDGAAEKKFLDLLFNTYGLKSWFFAIVTVWCIGFNKMIGDSGKIFFSLDRGLLLQVNRLGNLQIIVLRNEFEWKYIF